MNKVVLLLFFKNFFLRKLNYAGVFNPYSKVETMRSSHFSVKKKSLILEEVRENVTRKMSSVSALTFQTYGSEGQIHLVIGVSEIEEPDKHKTVNITREYLLVVAKKGHRTRKPGEGIFHPTWRRGNCFFFGNSPVPCSTASSVKIGELSQTTGARYKVLGPCFFTPAGTHAGYFDVSYYKKDCSFG